MNYQEKVAINMTTSPEETHFVFRTFADLLVFRGQAVYASENSIKEKENLQPKNKK